MNRVETAEPCDPRKVVNLGFINDNPVSERGVNRVLALFAMPPFTCFSGPAKMEIAPW
jgi:hypothetical protein